MLSYDRPPAGRGLIVGLPADRRLRRSQDITAVVRRGRRARSGGLVVHVAGRDPAPGVQGPRLAFVAPRTVGPAVVRNRVRRRLQEQLRALHRDGALVGDVDLVVRLLPGAAGAASPELGEQLRSTLRRLKVLAS